MKALITGSFDPPTLGHLDIIKRACAMFDSVTVCIFVNSNKNYTFDTRTRKSMIEAMCEGIDNLFVDFTDTTVPDYYERNGFDVIVKGVRNSRDVEYETELLELYKSQNAKVETVFLPGTPQYRWISSSAAREIMRYNADLTPVLHEKVIKLIK